MFTNPRGALTGCGVLQTPDIPQYRFDCATGHANPRRQLGREFGGAGGATITAAP
jgi:hypothetical protein